MGTQDHCISVIVDDRERGAGVFYLLNEMDEVSTSINRLPVGDYLVDDRLIFERKILRDFASSLIDGSLFRQMIRSGLKTPSNAQVRRCPTRGFASILTFKGASRVLLELYAHPPPADCAF